MMPHLFCFGLGYAAKALIRPPSDRIWTIRGTNRNGESGCRLRYACGHFDGDAAVAAERPRRGHPCFSRLGSAGR